MKTRLSITISLAVIATATITSMALVGDPVAHISFTTDAPCSVSVLVDPYTDPTNQPGQTAGGPTPWTLDVYPSSSLTFYYPTSIDCNGTTYNFVSADPSSPMTAGVADSTIIVTGHYMLPAPDTTSPVWNVPADFSVEATGPAGAIVTYSASATDPDDAVSSQSCSPTFGSNFPLGTTAVNCTATDTHGNIGTASFDVTVVDTTPPVLSLPSNMTVPAVDASGAPVNFDASATDLVDEQVPVTCIPASGSNFPLGTTTVTCTATDSHGNSSSGSFDVTVADNAAPVLTLPADKTVEAMNASGAIVIFNVSAYDQVDGSVPVNCLPASGSNFPLGTTTVNCSATDSNGNSAFGSFHITVVDTTPPVLSLPSDMTVPAVDASGAPVSFDASAKDLVDGQVSVTCSPASDSTFPLGTTTVTCTASDSRGNSSSGSFDVTVVDNAPPVLSLPSDMIVTAMNASGAVVEFTVSANDLVDGDVPVTCSPDSGSNFPFGTTTVHCSATDSNGNMAEGTFNITVQYATVGMMCKGIPGHQILEPINVDGTSVFKAGSTVPAKFRVCGLDGEAIGEPGTVTSFRIVGVTSNGITQSVDQAVSSTPPFDAFRSGSRQWIFDISTKDLDADNTYIFLITLNDGSTIQFQFTLK